MFVVKSLARSSQFGPVVLSLSSSIVGIEEEEAKKLKLFDNLIPVLL